MGWLGVEMKRGGEKKKKEKRKKIKIEKRHHSHHSKHPQANAHQQWALSRVHWECVERRGEEKKNFFLF